MKLFNKKGQNLWEFVLLFAVLAVVFIWMDFKKQTETNNIASGAKQTNVSDKQYSVLNLNLLNFGGSHKEQPVAAITPPKAIVAPIEPIVVDKAPEPSFAEQLGIPKEKMASIGHLSPSEKFEACLVIILIVMVLGGLLDAIGGDCIVELRRYAMPGLVALGVSTMTYIFYPVWYSWPVGLLVTPVMGTLTLGYGNFGSGNFSRAMWLFVQATIMGLGLFLVSKFCHTHLLNTWLYLWYIVSTGVWGGLYKNWKQWYGDWITGAWLCSIILYVYLTLQFAW